MSLIEIENQQYRRDILMFLQADSDYAMGNELLSRALTSIGTPISHDRLEQQLHWLKDQGLVKLATEGKVITAKLTARGEDVALCREHHPNIARPSL